MGPLSGGVALGHMYDARLCCSLQDSGERRVLGRVFCRRVRVQQAPSGLGLGGASCSSLQRVERRPPAELSQFTSYLLKSREMCCVQ